MLKMVITDAVVSKGYDGAPAIRFYSPEGGSGQIANFRIGKRVYDSKAEDKHRWLNFTVKAFDEMCERIKRMKLKEGSYINIIARYDEDTWIDKNTNEQRSAAVLYLEELEYSGGSSGQKSSQTDTDSAAAQGAGAQPAPQAYSPASPSAQAQQSQQWQAPAQEQAPPPMPGNFTGYETFNGGGNDFF